MHNLARAAAAAFLSAAVLTACDNPVGEREQHVRPARIAILSGTTELAGGTFGSITGSLTAQAGQQTGPLTVRFFTSAGAEISPSAEYHMRVTSGNNAIAQWLQATSGEFGGRVSGAAAGTTTLTFGYVHGAPGTGHSEADFVIPVTITP